MGLDEQAVLEANLDMGDLHRACEESTELGLDFLV
jgi:hypothetical protein